jgi:hypothetical protein
VPDCFLVIPRLFLFDPGLYDFFRDGSDGIFPQAYHVSFKLDFDFHFALLCTKPGRPTARRVISMPVFRFSG